MSEVYDSLKIEVKVRSGAEIEKGVAAAVDLAAYVDQTIEVNLQGFVVLVFANSRVEDIVATYYDWKNTLKEEMEQVHAGLRPLEFVPAANMISVRPGFGLLQEVVDQRLVAQTMRLEREAQALLDAGHSLRDLIVLREGDQEPKVVLKSSLPTLSARKEG